MNTITKVGSANSAILAIDLTKFKSFVRVEGGVERMSAYGILLAKAGSTWLETHEVLASK